jgi:hypothetical protein
MGVRNGILEGLKAALQGIRRVDGYSMDVGVVGREAVALANLQEGQTPAVFIDDSGEEKLESPVGSDQRRTMKITLAGIVRSAAGPSEKLNLFVSDLRRCLHSADLGAKVIFVNLNSLEVDVGPRDAVFAQEIEIVYYYPEGSP